MYPFTASQWKELQLQLLIFEYMASRVPIPQELMFCCFDPYYAHPCASLERVAEEEEEDPEPRRCRRTDGKKWRCAKEALPGSKYCERHVHRGKKVCSRKPVEIPLTTLSSSSTSRVQSLFGFSPQNGSVYSPVADRNCRYPEREEDADQCEERDRLWEFTPLEMSSLGETRAMKKNSSSSSTHFTIDEYKEEEKSHHCFVLGVDLMLQRPWDVNREDDGDWKPKPLLHLFDECRYENTKI